MNTISFNFSFGPLSHINISIFGFPYSSSILFTILPLSRIILSIIPKKLSDFRTFIIHKFSLIYTFCCNFNSFDFLRFGPFSFKDPIFSNHNPFSIHILFSNLSEIQRIRIIQSHSKIFTSYQLINIYRLITHSIHLDKI